MRRISLNSTATVCGLVAVGFSLSAASCVSSPPLDTFESGDPAGRMHAAGRAAATGDAAAIPRLVDMLASDDPAERLVAIGSLDRLTGVRLGYDPAGSDSSRQAAIGRWRAWVAARSGAVNDPATVGGGKTDR